MTDSNEILRDIAKFYEKAVGVISLALRQTPCLTNCEDIARTIIARLADEKILLERYDDIEKIEKLNWIPIQAGTPDEGVVVLLYHPEASEPVWPGVFEGCTADGYAFSHADGSMVSGPVLAWAEFPGGPE